MNSKGGTDIAEVEIMPGNIAHVTLFKGTELTFDSAKRMLLVIERLADKGIPYRAGMFDITHITYIDEEARTYLAEAEDIEGEIVGVALISTSVLGKTIGNMFLALANPSRYPTKLFNSPIRAEHWLRGKMREAIEDDLSNRQVA